MGICPSCGSYIDPGEPYCPDCGYIPGNDSSDDDNEDDFSDSDEYDFSEFDEDELEEALESRGYDMYDFENGLIDDDELEEIYEELS